MNLMLIVNCTRSRAAVIGGPETQQYCVTKNKIKTTDPPFPAPPIALCHLHLNLQFQEEGWLLTQQRWLLSSKLAMASLKW